MKTNNEMEREYGCYSCWDQGCGLCTDLEAQAREDELGAEFGDPRRCPIHGEMISSPDGMFDAPCGACEHAYDLESERATWEDPTRPLTMCSPTDIVWYSWRKGEHESCQNDRTKAGISDEICF